MTWLKAQQNERDPAAHVRRTQRWRRHNREWQLMLNGTLPGRGTHWAMRRRALILAPFALAGCEHTAATAVGMGTLMIGQGTIINGVATVIR